MTDMVIKKYRFRNWKHTVLLLCSVLCGISMVSAQEDPRGEWLGAIEVYGNELGITCRFGLDSTVQWFGDIDIPEQKAYGVELSEINLSEDRLSFSLNTPVGVAKFVAAIRRDNISGTFSQGELEAPFYLRRSTDRNAPYSREEFKFENDSVVLSGTLLLPERTGPHPAVVLISDEGSQDRDGTSAGFRPLRILADYLAREGFAVYRFDDRGFGRSGGADFSNYSMEVHRKDVLAAAKALGAHAMIRADQIGLVGFGEGGNIAMDAALENAGISWIVLAATPLSDGRNTVRQQQQNLWDLERLSASERSKASQLLEDIFTAVETGRDWPYVKSELQREALAMIDKMTEVEKGQIPDLNQWMQNHVDARMSTFQTEWFKSRSKYNPKEKLTGLRCPLLALFARHDLTADPDQQISRLIDGMERGGNLSFQIETFEDASHSFQLYNAALTGGDEFRFVNGFKEAIGFWIEAYTPASRQ